MTLNTVSSEKVKNKTVLLKVDFNVPLKKIGEEITIAEDTRIKITIPTIQLLVENNCKVVILSHAGRPKGRVVESLRLQPMADRLAKLMNRPVETCKELTGAVAQAKIAAMQPGTILVLENTRFDPRETVNDPNLAKELASYADVFVNESFSTAHRNHASVSGVAKILPAYAGIAFQNEHKMLTKLMSNQKRPFVAVIGGAKISGKIETIRTLTKIADVVLVGGGIAHNFIKAQGIDICNSYLEACDPKEKHGRSSSYVEIALDLMNENKIEKMLLNGYIPLPKIIYPSDVIAAKDTSDTVGKHIVSLTKNNNGTLEKDTMFLDIGPKTRRLYRDIILQAGTVFWNGPMGVFEAEGFAEGTLAVATAIAKTTANTTIGGGDTLNAISQLGLEGRFDHVSASGGAALALLTGAKLPGLEVLFT